MKKRSILLGSALAIMVAPSVLSIPTTTTNVSAEVNAITAYTPVSGYIGTVRRGGASIVDDNGNPTSNLLGNFTSWKIDATKTINDTTYYRVATNGWVSQDQLTVSDATGKVINPSNADEHFNYDPLANNIGTTHQTSALVNGNGQTIPGVTLPANTSWKLGELRMINNLPYFQVATDEWVCANDITVTPLPDNTQPTTSNPVTLSNVVGTVNTPYPAPVFNTVTQTYTSSRFLASGTSWKIANIIKNAKGEYFGQVSTNEWVSLYYLNTTSLTSISSSIGYIADFAI
jgi:hypothetical protein